MININISQTSSDYIISGKLEDIGIIKKLIDDAWASIISEIGIVNIIGIVEWKCLDSVGVGYIWIQFINRKKMGSVVV